MDFRKYQHLNTTNIDVWRWWQNLLNIKYETFVEPRTKPAFSLGYAANLFNLIKGDVIVECGTGLYGPDYGNSALYWFNETEATKIHYIDLEKRHINSVKNKLGSSPRITYHHNNCFNVVPSINNIDLLYMDFWDGDGGGRARAHLDLYNISNRPKIILIDDTDHSDPWKQTLVVPAAVSQGYKIVYVGRQTLLVSVLVDDLIYQT